MQEISTNSPASGLHPELWGLLQKRGHDEDSLKELLSWDLKNLPDLSDLKDLEKAAVRIIEAIENDEQIGVYGDYDVDGTTASALLYRFFQLLQVKRPVIVIQPGRFKEGYGLHCSSIDLAIEKKIDLLITVDCGITSTTAADYAKERELDLIITDHHKDGAPEMPEAYALINPSRRDEDPQSVLKALSGVGVAFCLALKVKTLLKKESPSLYPLLEYVAVGTLCDMVPLNPMNLKLVRHGLKQIPRSSFAGHRAFFTAEEKELTIAPTEKITFGIGPMINAKGRLEHPDMALQMLISDESEMAYHLKGQLETCNAERKSIQNTVFDQAKKQHIEDDPFANCVIVNGKDWHEGVIGIVASKCVETFKVPALVFTQSDDENILKASCRTAGELNLFEALNEMREFFLKFGGHKAACGLSLHKDRFEAFKVAFKNYLESIPAILRTRQVQHDWELQFSDINAHLMRSLEIVGPFGPTHERPLFRSQNVVLKSFKILKDLHVSWQFSQKGVHQTFKGISFFYIGAHEKIPPETLFERSQRGEGLTLTYHLGLNRFRGNETIQLEILEIE